MINRVQLLAELRSVSHDARVVRLIAIGRAARSDKKAQALLNELWGGEVYERRLVLKSCFASRDGARVLEAVVDPSRLVRGAARKLVALCCNDAQTVSALQKTYAVRQHLPILLALHHRGRRAPIDTFLSWLAARPEDSHVADLIPLASAAVLEKLLPLALRRPSTPFWERMLAFAPARLAQLLISELQRGPVDSQYRWVLAQTLVQLAVRVPDEACVIAELMLGQRMTIEHQVMARLIVHRPAQALELGLKHGYPFVAGAFAARARKLTGEQLARLITTNRLALGDPGPLFRRLPAAQKSLLLHAWLQNITQHPSWGLPLLKELSAESSATEREAAYRAWSFAARDSDGIIAREQINQLPPDLQQREAQRHLNEVTQLQTRPAERIAYSLYLGWEESRQHLQLYLGHPEGETRGHALWVLLQIPGRWPDRPELIDEALRLAKARKNEQDPVRLKMFQALDTWPRGLWQKKHLADFGQLVRDALDAADLSPITAQALERVLIKLFRLDGEVASKWLTTLIKERGTLYSPRLGAELSDAEVIALGAPLLQVAQAWAVREREGYLIGLCASLGKRISLVPGLVKLMEKVGEDTANASTSGALMTLLYEHVPTRAQVILGATIKRWIKRGWEIQLATLLPKLTELPTDIAELVEDVLLRTSSLSLAASLLSALRYRHKEHLGRIVPRLLGRDNSYICLEPLWSYVHRYRQELLTPLLGSEVVTGRFATGKTRWVLPFRDGFFRWNNEQQRTFGITLQHVVFDPERDTPTVFWAMERLPKLAFAPAEPLCKLADDKRAAVAEKAIRSLARLDAGQGVPQLILCLEDARARFAVYGLRGALVDLPPERAVELLQKVPLHKVTVAKEVLRLLGDLRSDAAYALLLSIDKPTLHRDIRVALLRALWEHLEREQTWLVLQRAAADPDWILSARLADIPADRLSAQSEPRLCALLAQILSRPEPEVRLDLLRRAPTLPLKDHGRVLMAACLQRLDSRFSDEVTAAITAVLRRAQAADVAVFEQTLAALRDNRRALQLIIAELRSLPSVRSQLSAELVQAAQRVLANDPRAGALLIDLAASAGGSSLTAALLRLADREILFADALAVAQTAVQGLPQKEAECFELQLRQHPHETLRFLAVIALRITAGPNQGWTPARRAQLISYQRDPSLFVSGAAQFIFPPAEESPPKD